MSSLARTIGVRIRTAREKAGLSQRELGDRVGLSHVGLGDLERGKNLANIAHLIELSSVLGRSVEHFLGIDNGLTDEEDELVTLFRSIDDQRLRRSLLASARLLAEDVAPSEREIE